MWCHVTLSASIEIQWELSILRGELEMKPVNWSRSWGPTGPGKTTMLRCLAGLSPIDRGRISIDESVVDDPAAGHLRRPETAPIGFVYQNYLLFDHMTVLETLRTVFEPADGEGRSESDRSAVGRSCGAQ